MLRMGIDKYFSEKCKTLSLLAMVSVVYIHSNTLGTLHEASRWNVVLQRLITCQLPSFAVPFFFCLSGYWFARERENFFSLLNKKTKRLLVPYMAWAVIGACLSLPVFLVNNHYNSWPLLFRTVFDSPTWFGCVDRLLGLSNNGPVGNLALWYVRALLVFFLLAPFWWWLRRLSRWLPFVLGLGLVVACGETRIPFMEIRYASFGWILLGMFSLGIVDQGRRLPLPLTLISGCLWFGFSVVGALGHSIDYNIIPVCGIVFVWSAYDYICGGATSLSPVFHYVRNNTFWVYCMHGSIMGYFLSGIPFVLGKTDAVMFCVMLFSPWMAIAVCTTCAVLTKRYLPGVFTALSGGRG